jgi:hypothetical protein
MTLLQSGLDWLGHSEIATTRRYAAADVEMIQPKDAVLRVAGSSLIMWWLNRAQPRNQPPGE